MEALARITLLKPYRDPEFVLHLRFGQRSLVAVGATSLGQVQMHVGWNMENPNRNDFQAAESIAYPLGWSEHLRTVTVPVDCAKLWFGDWRIVPGSPGYAVERRRVAQKWGDFKHMPHARMTPDGRYIADSRIVGPPDMPHVSIVELDTNGNVLTEPFLPWDVYKFAGDTDKRAVAEAEQSRAKFGGAAPSESGDFTKSPDFATAVAEAVDRAVDRAMAARTKAKSA